MDCSQRCIEESSQDGLAGSWAFELALPLDQIHLEEEQAWVDPPFPEQVPWVGRSAFSGLRLRAGHPSWEVSFQDGASGAEESLGDFVENHCRESLDAAAAAAASWG